MRHERIKGNGAELTDSQIRSMLEENKTLVKDLKGKKGSRKDDKKRKKGHWKKLLLKIVNI